LSIDEAKSFLGDRWCLSPNYRLEETPWHSLYEPVNVALTFAHVRRRDGQEQLERVTVMQKSHDP
jgi:hypothetical protein